MATPAMKKPKIEEGEEEIEAESTRVSTQIPDDRESLLEFMDQLAKLLQRLKDQSSIVDRKIVEVRNLMADAEAKFLRLDRVESDANSKTNPKMPGKNGSLLGIAEFWTEGTRAKTANETSTPQPRSEKESLKMPSIILPPSFKRRAPASARTEVNEITQAQPMSTRDFKNVPMEEKSGPEAKRSRSFRNEVVRETQGQDNENQSIYSRDYNVRKEDRSGPEAKRSRGIPNEVVRETQSSDDERPLIKMSFSGRKEDRSDPQGKKSCSIPNEVVRETQGSDDEEPLIFKMSCSGRKEYRSDPQAKRSCSIPNEEVRETQGWDDKDRPISSRVRIVRYEDRSGPEAKISCSIPNEVVRETQGRDNQTQTGARYILTNKDSAKLRTRSSSNISQHGQQEKSDFHGHDELIALIGRSSLRPTIEASTVSMLPSGHTKRVRSLALSPSNRELFASSALDGVVHFWKLRSDKSSATQFKTVNRVTVDQKKWAEDIAWHPHKSALFSVYTADEGHPQISALYLNEATGSCESKFLEDRPHSKGLINRVMFTPWDDPCFITGGSDHAVVLWQDQRGNTAWKARLLHRDLHSSAVMGVAGMRHNNLVLSCGDDRRFVGFDARQEKVTFKHRMDNRCTNLLPNPRDVNLVMVSTRQLDRQLRLYDVRLPQTELFCFGWKQESSESQSALINQSWSPDGLHISSGSSDPVIHIFDIRYNAPTPSLSMKAHKKRVFKAEWHSSHQLLVSISSDLAIGIHKLW